MWPWKLYERQGRTKSSDAYHHHRSKWFGCCVSGWHGNKQDMWKLSSRQQLVDSSVFSCIQCAWKCWLTWNRLNFLKSVAKMEIVYKPRRHIYFGWETFFHLDWNGWIFLVPRHIKYPSEAASFDSWRWLFPRKYLMSNFLALYKLGAPFLWDGSRSRKIKKFFRSTYVSFRGWSVFNKAVSILQLVKSLDLHF